ncbi:MAG: sulfatase family protein [Myxococcota bacterium]
MQHTRRDFLRALGWGAGVAVLPGCRAGSPGRPPNLLLLVSDDQRWDTLGCAGNPVIRTPELDRLAAGGTRFRNAFVTTSICPTSRASILTGQYLRRHRVGDFLAPLSDEALAGSYVSVLREAGYYVGFLGKWGIATTVEESFAAAARHFDYWAPVRDHGNYWHEADCPWVLEEGTGGGPGARCTCPPGGDAPRVGMEGIRRPRHQTTEILPAKFARFLDDRDPTRPFCLSVSFKAPHAPWGDWDPALRGLYADADVPLPPTFAHPDAADLPEFLRESPSGRSGANVAASREAVQDHLRSYYRQITGVDMAVGRFRAALAERGLDGDTVVLFSSDNGLLFGEHGLGSKWLMHEESIRVPLLVFDPRSERRGAVCDEMALNIDLAPTLVELAGQSPPDAMQGRSLVPLLADPTVPFRDDWFYEHHFRTARYPILRTEGVRGRRFKYVRYLDRDPPYEQLFDLAEDPHETRDLARQASQRQRLASLRQRWRACRRSLR